jgi:hypothetical protein
MKPNGYSELQLIEINEKYYFVSVLSKNHILG